jgi:flagellar motor switch protein FliM
MSAEVSVLTKKLRQGGVARSPLAETDLIVESLARGIEDRLRPLVKTMVTVTVDTVAVVKLAAATGRIAAPAMMGVIEVEDADTPALIACDAALTNHLIDLTLGGDPATSPDPSVRPFTAIDMALGRLHLDSVLQAFTHALGVGFGRPLTKALRIRDQRQNLSQLRLAPDYIDVLTFAATVSLGEAGRTGFVTLVLPLSALDAIRASIQARNQVARERPNDLWKALMRRAAASAPVPVDAVLHRQRLSLAALQALKVGQVIEIPRQAVEETRLTIPQPGGRTALLAMGRLGGYQDNKVVKLATAPDPRISAHIDRALNAATPGPDDSPRGAHKVEAAQPDHAAAGEPH